MRGGSKIEKRNTKSRESPACKSLASGIPPGLPLRIVGGGARRASESRAQNSLGRRGSLCPGGLEWNVHDAYYHGFVTKSITIYLVCIRIRVPFWEKGAEKSGLTLRKPHNG